MVDGCHIFFVRNARAMLDAVPVYGWSLGTTMGLQPQVGQRRGALALLGRALILGRARQLSKRYRGAMRCLHSCTW